MVDPSFPFPSIRGQSFRENSGADWLPPCEFSITSLSRELLEFKPTLKQDAWLEIVLNVKIIKSKDCLNTYILLGKIPCYKEQPFYEDQIVDG